jgi:Putative zinc-finger
MARQNDHNRAEELMSAYLDKRVSAEERIFFERHIASCADCRAQLETTRSMVAALKAMPAVKAPRSFVLPREMAKEPKRSFFSLYPALRLATVVAAMAFAMVFAGDLLINQMGGASAPQAIPAAAPAPVAIQAPAAPRQAVAPTQESAAETSSAAATAPVEPPAPAAAAGAAAKVSATAVMTETTMAMAAPTATPEATMGANAGAAMMLKATPESSESMPERQDGAAAEQSAMAYTAEAASAPAIDPLRVIEIALLVLVVVLGIATIVVRRKQA